jgi:hypothetical protein
VYVTLLFAESKEGGGDFSSEKISHFLACIYVHWSSQLKPWHSLIVSRSVIDVQLPSHEQRDLNGDRFVWRGGSRGKV